MTIREAAIVSTYTGILIGNFEEMHKYAEQILGRSIFTHEFADKDLWAELKQLSKADFCAIQVTEDK